MTIGKVFKSTIPSMNYVFKDGTSIAFLGGKIVLDIEKYSQELLEEVQTIGRHKSKHQYIFIDENEQEIDSEGLSPLEELKAQLKAEAMEEVKRSMNLIPSDSEQGKFGASLANSKNSANFGDSNSGAVPNASELISAAKSAAANKAAV